MSCHGGTHFSCECQRELLENALEALVSVVSGIDKYRETLSVTDKTRLTHFIHALPSARSVIRRSRISHTR